MHIYYVYGCCCYIAQYLQKSVEYLFRLSDSIRESSRGSWIREDLSPPRFFVISFSSFYPLSQYFADWNGSISMQPRAQQTNALTDIRQQQQKKFFFSISFSSSYIRERVFFKITNIPSSISQCAPAGLGCWAGLLGKMAGSYQVAFIAFPRRVTQPLILFIIFLLLRQNISLEFLDSIQL